MTKNEVAIVRQHLQWVELQAGVNAELEGKLAALDGRLKLAVTISVLAFLTVVFVVVF